MQADEFDKFADEYLKIHAENLKLSGEDPEYFARYKIEVVRRHWETSDKREPTEIVDFGCGIGASLPHLRRLFPAANLTGIDVSERSLSIAADRFSDVAQLLLYGGDGALPLKSASADLIFSACVFHHIPAPMHVGLLTELRRVLAPNGVVMIFEHNPVNPVTRYIVATCPFDENAVLIAPGELKFRLMQAGFSSAYARYTGFFPGALSSLRVCEPWLSRLPIGAQYYVVAHA